MFQLKIGNFILTQPYGVPNENIAIYRDNDGEGGNFQLKELEKVIAKFYHENF